MLSTDPLAKAKPVKKQALRQKLSDYLSTNQLKSTKQRDVIVETFFSMDDKHVTIDELLEEVRKTHESIGYATVYRTLMLLVEAKIAHQRQFHDGQSRFELNLAHHHDHLICLDCDQIIEFENDTIETIQEEIAESKGFELAHHKMELYGHCQTLKKTGKCPHQK